jgi:hypothetical protein
MRWLMLDGERLLRLHDTQLHLDQLPELTSSAEQQSEPMSSARIAACIGWSEKFFWLQNWFCMCK